jgi:hypothetical protein
MSLQSIYDIIQGWKGKWGWRCENWPKFDNLEECWTKLIGNSYYFQKITYSLWNSMFLSS